MSDKPTQPFSIEDLSSKFHDDKSSLSGSPTELSASQKLTRFMSLILLIFVFLMIILSINLWDGSKDGNFSDFWEYTKLIGTMIIGGVVATYLQPNNNGT